MLENLKKYRGNKLSFAGVVTDVEHKQTKSGKPFGILYLEDYKGSYSFYLFGDDYINFKSYFTIGWLLQVSGQIKKRFYDENLEFKISSIILLSELIDNEIRDLNLRVSIDDINDDLVNQLVDILSNNKGKHSLVFNLIDYSNKYDVNLLSRKIKVKIDKEFVEKINNLGKIKLSIK